MNTFISFLSQMNLNWTAVAVSVVLLIGTSVFMMLAKRLLLANSC